MTKILITKIGYEKIQKELKILKTIERPAVIAAIAEAREHGDLSENAEYSAAREKQSFLEGRINELENCLSRADIIDSAIQTGDTVTFATTVTLLDLELKKEITYQIVSDVESNIKENLLSIQSPLARAIINKKIKEIIESKTPAGIKEYKIIQIQHI